MKGNRLKLLAFGIVFFIVVAELASAGALFVANRIFDEPILPTRRIYSEQTERLERMVSQDPASRRDQLDSTLGWTYAAGWNADGDVINGQGIRARREFTNVSNTKAMPIATRSTKPRASSPPTAPTPKPGSIST